MSFCIDKNNVMKYNDYVDKTTNKLYQTIQCLARSGGNCL